VPALAHRFAALKTVPDKYLLFFHHLPWSQRLADGQPLWDSLIVHYDRGVAQVETNRRQWNALGPFVDIQRFSEVSKDLDRQVLEAWWWRDASIAYWESLSKLPLQPGHSSPAHPLSYYESIHFDTVPGFKIPRIDARTLCVAGRGGPKCAL
jgi:alpha-glucuronidase